MGTSSLSSRAIIGEFYRRLEQQVGSDWIGALTGEPFDSDQASEEYRWLGMSPVMREWIGGRHAKGLREYGMIVRNKKFETTLELDVDDLRRDKTSQTMVRVREMADRTNAHWAQLLSYLIASGESQVCYDGQYFFDSDHEEGDSGVQSNIATFKVANPTDPTPAEFEKVFLKTVETILQFKDDQNEPLNDGASRFRIMIPIHFMSNAAAALKNQIIVEQNTSRTNTITNTGIFSFTLDINSRLPWKNKLAIFRADGNVKPLIRQEEMPVELDSIAEGSELEFKENKHWYGVKAIRNVAYGYWQHACLVNLE